MTPYGTYGDTSAEKAFKMRRAIAQAVGHRMKDSDDLVDIFPDKTIGEKNIALHYRKCGYRILTDFDMEEKKRTALQFTLLRAYKKGIDLSTNERWNWLYYLCMGNFSDKIKTMTDIVQLAFMDKTEQEETIMSDPHDDWM